MPEKISEEQGRLLLKMARNAISERFFVGEKDRNPARPHDDGFLQLKRGAFVTLLKAGQLRGCIGTIEPVSGIGDAVRENARFAAFRDTRFSPLMPEELDQIDIEVSILSPPKPLAYGTPAQLPHALTPGADGVVVKKGGNKATFLPQVWEQLPSARDFLTHLCMKAGLAPDAWETQVLDISLYRVQSFKETGHGSEEKPRNRG